MMSCYLLKIAMDLKRRMLSTEDSNEFEQGNALYWRKHGDKSMQQWCLLSSVNVDDVLLSTEDSNQFEQRQCYLLKIAINLNRGIILYKRRKHDDESMQQWC